MTTAESQQLAQQRLADIAQRQAALSAQVTAIQRGLSQRLDAASDQILSSPSSADATLVNWAKTDLLKTVGQWAGDILAVGRSNGDYFRQLAGSPKDYLAVQAQAVPLLLNRFGLEAGGQLQPGGFFAGFMGDTNLASQVKQLAWKSKAAGVGLQQFKRDINALVDGSPDRAGLVQRHFNTFAYDTYQQADAQTQDFYAVKLQLPAALYLGGEIAGTREFCHERQGNVYTREEIAGWINLEFNGKTPDYNPFTDRGGYNCRHHLHYITARMAASRRTDLTLGTDGKLYKEGEKQPVTVAPARQTAPAVQPPADVQVESSPAEPTTPQDAPASYTTQAELENAIKLGGWENDFINIKEFNAVASGLDLERLGLETRRLLEASGIKVEYLSVGTYDNELTISASGKLPNATNPKMGKFTMDRSFRVNPKTGDRTVNHSLLIMPEDLQGNGLGKELFNTLNNEYRAANIRFIKVHANIDVGGYAWSKYGFSAATQDEAYKVLSFAENRRAANPPVLASELAAENAAMKEMEAIVDKFYKLNDYDVPFPMDKIANVPGAKKLMLGSDWYGQIDLTDTRRRDIWESYIKPKK